MRLISWFFLVEESETSKVMEGWLLCYMWAVTAFDSLGELKCYELEGKWKAQRRVVVVYVKEKERLKVFFCGFFSFLSCFKIDRLDKNLACCLLLLVIWPFFSFLMIFLVKCKMVSSSNFDSRPSNRAGVVAAEGLWHRSRRYCSTNYWVVRRAAKAVLVVVVLACYAVPVVMDFVGLVVEALVRQRLGAASLRRSYVHRLPAPNAAHYQLGKVSALADLALEQRADVCWRSDCRRWWNAARMIRRPF